MSKNNNNNNNPLTWKIVDFAVPVDHRVKSKEREKKDRYLNITRELRKPWNMKVTFILIIIGAHAKVTKRLINGMEDLEIKGQVETIQTTELLR